MRFHPRKSYSSMPQPGKGETWMCIPFRRNIADLSFLFNLPRKTYFYPLLRPIILKKINFFVWLRTDNNNENTWIFYPGKLKIYKNLSLYVRMNPISKSLQQSITIFQIELFQNINRFQFLTNTNSRVTKEIIFLWRQKEFYLQGGVSKINFQLFWENSLFLNAFSFYTEKIGKSINDVTKIVKDWEMCLTRKISIKNTRSD